jgi:hypothetical protein
MSPAWISAMILTPAGYIKRRIAKQALLKEFVACAYAAVDAYKARFPQHASEFEAARSSIVQFAVWQARGAARAQMIHFFVTYHHSSRPPQTRWTLGRARVGSESGPLIRTYVCQCKFLQTLNSLPVVAGRTFTFSLANLAGTVFYHRHVSTKRFSSQLILQLAAGFYRRLTRLTAMNVAQVLLVGSCELFRHL